MLKRYGSNAAAGIIGSLVLLFLAGFLGRLLQSEALAGFFMLMAVVSYVWGCTQLAQSKGYSAWWGALALLSLVGLIILLVMPDESVDESSLFASERTSQRAAGVPGSESVSYSVQFGGAFSVDGFDFVRRGTVSLVRTNLRFEGHRKRSVAARTGMFLLFAVIGLVPAYIFVNYFWTVRDTLLIPGRSISSVVRHERRIRLCATHPLTGKSKKSDFQFETLEQALRAEREIGQLMVMARANRATAA